QKRNPDAGGQPSGRNSIRLDRGWHPDVLGEYGDLRPYAKHLRFRTGCAESQKHQGRCDSRQHQLQARHGSVRPHQGEDIKGPLHLMPMTNHMNSRVRRGFTLIELLVGIVIFAIVGALFTKLLTVQGKFFDIQGMGNAARNVSRSSLNRIISDFRMIEATGGVINASPTSLTIRIPYAIGVECADDAEPATHLTLLPVDSTTYANSSFYGYAWRSATTGVYTYVEGGTSV